MGDERKEIFWPEYKEAILAKMNSDRNLTPSAKVVGFFLVQHLNQKSLKAFPSINTLVKLSGYCRRSVIRALGKLVYEGHWRLLKKGGGNGQGGPGSTSIYTPVLRVTEMSWLREGSTPHVNEPNDLRVTIESVNSDKKGSLRVSGESPEPEMKPKSKNLKDNLTYDFGPIKPGRKASKKDNSTKKLSQNQKLAMAMGAKAWDLIAMACDPKHPNHKNALQECKAFAEKRGLYWQPKKFPIISKL